jgi:uncharacterized membrane protein YuzA (DUF378 family)
MTNREYIIEVHSSNKPDRVIGIYTASTTGNKAIKLYDISLDNPTSTFDANVINAMMKDENTTSNETDAVFIYTDSEDLTDNVTFTIYQGSDLSVPLVTYTTTSNDVYYTYSITNKTNVSLLAQTIIWREGEEYKYTSYLNRVTEIASDLMDEITDTTKNWFFMLLLSTIAIMASLSTANYMSLGISAFALILAMFGWFGISKYIIGFAILVSLISIFSTANKRPDI